MNAAMLASYTWNPGVLQAENNIKWYISELKAQGILDASTNEDTCTIRFSVKLFRTITEIVKGEKVEVGVFSIQKHPDFSSIYIALIFMRLTQPISH